MRAWFIGLVGIIAIAAAAAAEAVNGGAADRAKEVSIMEKNLSLAVHGQEIPAILSLPESGQPEWGVVVIPGSFPNDVDGNYSMELGSPFAAKPHMYKDLAVQLAGRGVAALRYARGGVNTVDAAEAAAHRHFADRASVVVEAVRALRVAVPGISRVAVAGHSEGGPVALLLLSQNRDIGIDAYVSLSAPARRMFDIMLQQIEATVEDGYWSFGGMKFPFADYARALALVRKGEPVPEDLRKTLPPFGVHTMDAASQNYLREYDQVDSSKLIAAVTCPVLIVQGGKDSSVLPDNADMLFEAAKARPASTEKAFFPDLQHFYKKIPSGLDPALAFGLETESDPAVADAIAAWLRKIAKAKNP
jgi:hypothetical protein